MNRTLQRRQTSFEWHTPLHAHITVCTHGHTHRWPCLVVGETQRCYRITVSAPTPLLPRQDPIDPGEVVRIAKTHVEIDP